MRYLTTKYKNRMDKAIMEQKIKNTIGIAFWLGATVFVVWLFIFHFLALVALVLFGLVVWYAASDKGNHGRY